MVDRDLMHRVVAARDELDLLVGQATAADQERHELHDAVKAIRNTLTDSLLDNHQKVDQALRLVSRTLKAWEARRD